MTDALGPANAANAVTSRPADTRVFGLLDTWFKDCTSALLKDGTAVMASYLNGTLGQLRNLLRANGSTVSGNAIVTENNSDDAMIVKAVNHLIQRGQQNYGVAAGSANALNTALSPALAEYKAGIELRLKITATNTGAATLNVNSLGDLPIVRPDGAILAPADLRAGAVVSLVNDAGTAWQLVSAKPGVLTTNLDYYVNGTTGSDSNTGTDSAHPFATIQRAINAAIGFDLNGYSVTIHVADGAYAQINLNRFSGTGSINLIGNPSTPSACVISQAGWAASCSYVGYSLNGFKLQSPTTAPVGTPGAAIWGVPGCVLSIKNIEYGTCVGDHIVADGATITIEDGVQRLAGGAQAHLHAVNGGVVRTAGASAGGAIPPSLVVATASSLSNAFASADVAATIVAVYSSITNAGAVTGKRYSATGNGVINTGGQGASYFPGTIAGTTSTGGQYL